jgi:small subunit ribosomal protein S2
MKEVTLEELLEAGCHFGHQVTRHNPKARDFVFEAKDNIHIIDLAKTKQGLDDAAEFVKKLAQKDDSSIIVVGTKRQAQDIVKKEVERVRAEGATGIYYVTNRWIGGILTNFPEVLKNFKKLKDFTERLANEALQVGFTKKEVGGWAKEREKLESFYGGISEMTRTPDALFIIDTHMEDLAVREAIRTNTTTVGMVDTNADPFIIDHPIPANDDAVGSIELIVKHIVDAWLEGKLTRKQEVVKAEEKAEALIEEPAKEEKKEVKEKKVKTPKKAAVKKAKKAESETAEVNS